MIDLSVEHLLDCSRAALQDMRIRKLARSANCRKEMLTLVRGILDDWVQARAEQLVVDFFLEHGEKLVLCVLEEHEKPKAEAITHATKQPTHPPLTRAATLAHWRSERRYNQRKRAG